MIGQTVRIGGAAIEQTIVVELEYDSKRHRTRREVLEKMDWLVPWHRLKK